MTIPVSCQKSAEVGRLSIGLSLAAYELSGCAAYERQTDSRSDHDPVQSHEAPRNANVRMREGV
jgi:hypothetical protein